MICFDEVIIVSFNLRLLSMWEVVRWKIVNLIWFKCFVGGKRRVEMVLVMSRNVSRIEKRSFK